MSPPPLSSSHHDRAVGGERPTRVGGLLGGEEEEEEGDSGAMRFVLLYSIDGVGEKVDVPHSSFLASCYSFVA